MIVQQVDRDDRTQQQRRRDLGAAAKHGTVELISAREVAGE
jgi:hypothetical protein